MKVANISSYITPKTTGYAAAAGLGFASLSGLTKNKSLKKMHKPFAIISSALTLFHIGLIEYYHYKYKSK